MFNMTEKLEVGQIVEGKVTGIQPYGAFVTIAEDTQGLVHISEITHGYVKDINDYLKIGEQVKVKVLNIDEKTNKIALSIRATEKAPSTKTAAKKQTATSKVDDGNNGFNSLKDKLQEWIEQSKEREKIYK